MSGRLSALWLIVSYLPIAAGAFASGYISEHLRRKQTFVPIAALTFSLALLGLWKPRAVFSHIDDKPKAKGANFFVNVRRLVKHVPFIQRFSSCSCGSFAQGSATPLQFYPTNELLASDAVFSYFYGSFTFAFIPTIFLYGFLCKKVPLYKLLWWGTLIAIPQMIPMAFIHTPDLALASAVPIGKMVGIATAAYFDLAMKSCPPGLQGTLMMLVDGVYYPAQRGGNLLGSKDLQRQSHARFPLLRDCGHCGVGADPAPDPCWSRRN